MHSVVLGKDGMTIEEAMHELKIQSQVLESMILYNKDFEPKNDNTSLENKKNAIDIGIKALEKQTPMKPIKTIEHNIGYYKCAYCENKIGTDIMTYQSNHCGYCGQKLDWSK